MPENAHSESPTRVFDRLNRAVLGPGRLAKLAAEPPERLMVMGFHGRTLAEDGSNSTARIDPDVVIGELTRRVQVAVVPDNLGQVLHEVAAECDVQDLAAAADCENRHVPLERGAEERELGLVASRVHAGGRGVCRGAVGTGIDVASSREDEPVEGSQCLRDALLGRWNDEGTAASALDRADVRGWDKRGLDVPGPPRDGLVVRGDADQRSDRTPLSRYVARRS
jgi:hypothetical protein